MLIGLAVGSAAPAVGSTAFSDDFELYALSDPADFSATGNWFYDGPGDPATDLQLSRIFASPNFGGSQLWIAGPGDIGVAIFSRGIEVAPNTDYQLSLNLVAETTNGLRDNLFSLDVLAGGSAQTATTLLGGPLSIVGRGDHDGSIAGSIDNSYADQLTELSFNTGALTGSDRIFIRVAYQAVGPSGNAGFPGVDNVLLTADDGLMDFMALVVNTTTGRVELANDVPRTTTFNGYAIRSDAGSLGTAFFESLQEQGIDGNGIPNDGLGWESLGTADSGELAEANLFGSTALGITERLALGVAYDIAVDARDLS